MTDTRTFHKSFSIDDDDDDGRMLRAPCNSSQRPKSGVESTFRRFDSSSSLNHVPSFLRQSIRDLKSMVQKKSLKEDSLPPSGADSRDDDVTASNLSLNTNRKSFFSRLKRKKENKRSKESVSSCSEFDLRTEDWKDRKNATIDVTSFLQSPLQQPSKKNSNSQATDRQTNDKSHLNETSSANMPPPQSTNVPLSMANNKKYYQRRQSCHEVSNSSLDDCSSLSSNNCDVSQQHQQPNTFKGFLKEKLIPSNLSRSQSDSQKKGMQSFKFINSARSLSSDEFLVLKSSDTMSSKASDSTSEAEVLHTLPEEESKMKEHIMGLEDEEDEEIEGIGQYSTFEEVCKHNMRLATFLHFLLQHSDAVPLLFHMLEEAYRQASVKEQCKWAYELYSSFVHPSAPLRLSGGFDTSQLDARMKEKPDKEELGSLFDEVRMHCTQLCHNHFADFKYKLSMGLGSLYGLNNSDAASLQQHFSKQLSSLAKRNDETSTLLAASVVAAMRLLGFHANGASFVHKEKSKLSLFSKASKKASLSVQGHHLSMHNFSSTYFCHHCSLLICGPSPQAFFCLRCEQGVHRACAGQQVAECAGSHKIDRSKTTAALVRKKKSNKSRPEDSDSGATLPRAVSMMSMKESSFKAPLKNKLMRADRVDQTDLTGAQQRSTQAKSLHIDPSSPYLQQSCISTTSQYHSTYLSGKSFSDSEKTQTMSHEEYEYDSDFECEEKSLEAVYSREVLRKMKKEERKKQSVILELLHTERTHVRNLKVMHNLIHAPLIASQDAFFVTLLFPNLPAVISVHDELNKALKEKQKSMQGRPIDSITDVLLAHFVGERQEIVKKECARFCEKQGQALDELRARQKKEPKLASLLQDAQADPLCRRFELKDLLPTAMQRLTKYPLLISNILKHTQDADECRRLQSALEGSRSILDHVNSVVRRHDNLLRLQHLQRRLEWKIPDNHPIKLEYQDLDLTKHGLVLEGGMQWRINRDKVFDVQAVLLHHLLLLLLKVDDRLVLKLQTTYITAGRQDTRTTHCPLIPLASILVKTSASDDKAFFLVSQLNVPQFYDLIAPSSEDKNRWCKRIEEAVEAFRQQHPDQCHPHKLRSHRKTPSTVSVTSLPASQPPPTSITRSSTIPSSTQPIIFQLNHPTIPPSNCSTIPPPAQPTPPSNNSLPTNSASSNSTQDKTSTDLPGIHLTEELQQLDGSIEALMRQKWQLIGQLAGNVAQKAVLSNGEGVEKGGVDGGVVEEGEADRRMMEEGVDGDERVVDGMAVDKLDDVKEMLGEAEGLLREVQKDSEGGEVSLNSCKIHRLLLHVFKIQRKMNSFSQHLALSFLHPSLSASTLLSTTSASTVQPSNPSQIPLNFSSPTSSDV